MATYKRILIAIDFSPEGSKVVEQGIALGKSSGAELSLVHVVEHVASIYDSEASFPEIPDIEKRLTEKATAGLEKVKQDCQVPDAECHVRCGAPKHVIVDLAKETNADLIVIGSHGRHGLQLLLGSTANGVLHLATCDVLAVRIGR
ncbi:MAG: universal stress protein [Gammaproteobacteria bacterium]|nr:universal stress protein [Gammaproteobacteria bacterium]